MKRAMGLALVLCMLAGCGTEPASMRDPIGTQVAEAQAVAATLTAAAPVEGRTPVASQTATPDAVATGVAVQRAIAATLTAGIATATRTPIQLPKQTPDAVATGVAVQEAIAGTLTAEAPIATRTPDDTPLPTVTISPSRTPTAPPTPTDTPAAPDCVSWVDAHAHVGSHQCICGIVTGTYDDPNSAAFFINFGHDRTGYYAVSFSHTFEGLESRCIRICGTVDLYNGRPQTVVSSPDQIQDQAVCP